MWTFADVLKCQCLQHLKTNKQNTPTTSKFSYVSYFSGSIGFFGWFWCNYFKPCTLISLLLVTSCYLWPYVMKNMFFLWAGSSACILVTKLFLTRPILILCSRLCICVCFDRFCVGKSLSFMTDSLTSKSAELDFGAITVRRPTIQTMQNCFFSLWKNVSYKHNPCKLLVWAVGLKCCSRDMNS